jgi:bifunctional diaminopimelate decarboxylase / aspartate kinase
MTDPSSSWVVLKFGGTSVSTLSNWELIAEVVRRRTDDGFRVLVVHSAIAGVSNALEAVVSRPLMLDVDATITGIEEKHRQLAALLDVDGDTLLSGDFAEMRQLSTGINLVGEASPKAHARLMALGELMATRLGAAFLSSRGIVTHWIDARRHLASVVPRGVPDARSYLSADCTFDFDPSLRSAFDEAGGVLVTQGFIASNARGETVLLGRGGSDTSAAYFGAKLGASRVEIWTDVPGMFSADPRFVPDARLLRTLDYDEAQEIATTGAKVLHPRCIAPVRQARTPMWVLGTSRPDAPGTVIGAVTSDAPQVKAVSVKTGIVLVSMETVGMWQQVGFLADAFACFKRNGLSIDLVSTSETEVTVSLDPSGNVLDDTGLEALKQDLGEICRVRVLSGCATVSLVGRRIRSILPRLGPALELFGEHRMHLVTQAASDLNLSFVVDEDDAKRLARDLHSLLIRRDGDVFGPAWKELQARPDPEPSSERAWWSTKRDRLVAIAADGPAYVYDGETLDRRARRLTSMTAVDRVLFAMKANPNREVLARFEALGLGFECVSPGEIARVIECFPSIDRARILFTPNFAPRAEYANALDLGVHVTLDNLYPLRAWPELFREREIFVRLDLGHGRGHHAHVRTAGEHSKFGVPVAELTELGDLAENAGAIVTGLHSHSGSGVMTHDAWAETAGRLAAAADGFAGVRVLDLGGGLGVPDTHEGRSIDVAAIDEGLAAVRKAYPRFQIWLEPGRYLVAEAGVLVSRVTQVKGKSDLRYVGIETGMNSLIRPALYGAWHEIVNLSRLGEPTDSCVTVVGPICESGDVLGSDRWMPDPREGDVLLIGNAGAYGRAMSSSYNLREPAREVIV